MKGANAGLARPYAKAVFEYAQEKDALASWQHFLETLNLVFLDPEIKSRLIDPTAGERIVAETLIAILGAGLSVEQVRFLRLLSDNKRMGCFEEIAQQFKQSMQQQKKILPVQVSVSGKLTAGLEKSLKEALVQRVGHEVEVEYVENPALLGGVVISYRDTLIDGSLSYRLQKLSQDLKSRMS